MGTSEPQTEAGRELWQRWTDNASRFPTAWGIVALSDILAIEREMAAQMMVKQVKELIDDPVFGAELERIAQEKHELGTTVIDYLDDLAADAIRRASAG